LKKQFFARCNPFTLSDDLVVLNASAEWCSHTILLFYQCCLYMNT
jgi:hypothetical protein